MEGDQNEKKKRLVILHYNLLTVMKQTLIAISYLQITVNCRSVQNAAHIQKCEFVDWISTTRPLVLPCAKSFIVKFCTFWKRQLLFYDESLKPILLGMLVLIWIAFSMVIPNTVHVMVLWIMMMFNNVEICDMIKRNESDVGDVVFEILAKRVFKFLCFILFLALSNHS